MEKVLELIAGQDVCLLFISIHAGLWVLICTVFYIVFVFFALAVNITNQYVNFLS